MVTESETLSPSTADRRRGRFRRGLSRRRKIVIAVCALIVVIGAVAAWVGVRGYLAKNELEAALPLAGQLKTQIVAGDAAGAALSADQLGEHAAAAADLTGDPVWRAVELVPWVGPNLRVVREMSSTVDDVARHGIQPLTTLAGSVNLEDFKPNGGRIDLQPLIDARPALAEASTAIAAAETRIDDLDASGTLQPLVDARQKLLDGLSEASSGLTALDNAAQVLPAMLGADGPRNYLVLFQNNAELRSTGGIPGAMALVQTDGGGLSLKQQEAASDFREFDSPVVELPLEIRALYGDNTAKFMQNVTYSPDFALSGQIAREMWNRKFGLQVDGVISIDPVALSYLLEATGPVTLATGDQLTSGNAVKLLLQDVYARYPNPAEQDAFFASAASTVFAKISAGDINPQALISALGHAGEENRILIWSAHAEDQAVLADTTLAGGLPVSDDEVQNFGVYLNDATTAKMDPYLQVSIAAGQAVCRNDGLPLNSVQVTLTNTAPADSGSVLSDYVTGGSRYGIPAGNIRTNVAAYGAPGLYNLGVARDGKSVQYQPASDSGYGVSKLQVELVPGESTTLDFQFLGNDAHRKTISVQHTPLVYPIETLPLDVNCDVPLK